MSEFVELHFDTNQSVLVRKTDVSAVSEVYPEDNDEQCIVYLRGGQTIKVGMRYAHVKELVEGPGD